MIARIARLMIAAVLALFAGACVALLLGVLGYFSILAWQGLGFRNAMTVLGITGTTALNVAAAGGGIIAAAAVFAVIALRREE